MRGKKVAFRARISQVFVVQRDAREQYRLPECSHCVNGSEPARVPLGALAPLRGLMPPLGVAGAEAREEQPCRTNQAAHSAVELLPVRKRRVLARSSDRYRLAGRIAALQSARQGIGSARRCGLGIAWRGHVPVRAGRRLINTNRCCPEFPRDHGGL